MRVLGPCNVYGTTLTDSSVASTGLLRAVIYPDSDDPTSLSGSGTDSVFDRVEMTYNRLGQVLTRKDQRESVHSYDYDKLGRLLHDRVTSLGWVGENVDGSVLRISRDYDVRGMVSTVTSYDHATPGTGSVLNQVAMAYNDLGQLTSEHQDHDSAKDAGTLTVTYSYEAGTDATKGIRPITLGYPHADGATSTTYRTLHYLYADAGDTSGVSHYLSRISALGADTTRGTDDANVIAGYSYLGAGAGHPQGLSNSRSPSRPLGRSRDRHGDQRHVRRPRPLWPPEPHPLAALRCYRRVSVPRTPQPSAAPCGCR